MDYINLRLTGKCAATQNTALPLLMVDNRRLDRTDYDPWLVKTGGIDREKLPDLIPIDSLHGKLLPSVAAEWGLRPALRWSAASTTTAPRPSAPVRSCRARPAAVLGTSGYLASHVPLKRPISSLDGHHAQRDQGQLPVLG